MTQKAQPGKQVTRFTQWWTIRAAWTKQAYIGLMVMLVGMVLLTLLILLLNSMIGPLPSPGLIYLPLVAMLAYHWGWRYTLAAFLLELACIYYFFLAPEKAFKALSGQSIVQLVTITAVTVFVLAIVWLARQRRSMAEERAAQLSALNRVGTALSGELDESRLLNLIAETARNLTGASFAAFTMRPLNELGQPVGPSEGNHFHLAAVVGVTKEQERLFRRMPLGGEGLLAPIFRYGVPVRVPDALTITHGSARLAHGDIPGMTGETPSPRENAREAASYYAQGLTSREDLRTLGVPRGHPIVRSFLGAPLLDREGQVRGGLLLGHTEPDRFTAEDESMLVGLATQAAVAIENARLYQSARTQARELDAIFESIADGISLIDEQGTVLRENHVARQLRESVEQTPTGAASLEALLHEPADRALQGNVEQGIPVTLANAQRESRDYLVSAAPLRLPTPTSGLLTKQGKEQENAGAVVVWHDVTEARRLIVEQRAHAETKAQRALLQTVIDELPGSIYLVRGHDARLVLANRATQEVWGAKWETGQPMSEFLAKNGIRIVRNDGRPLPLNELATIRTLQSGVSVRHFQETIRHNDGTTLPVLANAVSIDPRVPGLATHDEHDEKAHDMEPAAIVVHQDVTALKEAERIKDDFIGIAAHELRNPLAALKGFAQMLGRVPQPVGADGEPDITVAPTELNEWQREAVEAIDQATNRLVELTDDLLDVTRLQAGRLALHTEPTDLVALVRRVVGRLRVTTTSHTFTIDASPAYIVADSDRQRIEQVITNLLNNAIKYSPDGGPITIMARVQPSGHEALLAIQDCGIGIPHEQQNRIFGRFVRADNARMREIKGTGLGLYLSRELVELHDGRIWFDSIEGQGSTFYVALPLSCDEETV